jgi:hypothetical protein
MSPAPTKTERTEWISELHVIPAGRANLIPLPAIERLRTTPGAKLLTGRQTLLRKTVPTTTIASAMPCRAVPLPVLALVALAARLYDTFLSTGAAVLAEAALASDFVRRTLPPGRRIDENRHIEDDLTLLRQLGQIVK